MLITKGIAYILRYQKSNGSLLTDSRVRLAAARNTLESVWRSPAHANFTLVNPAAARQTLKQFWRPPGRLQSVFGGRYRDSRVFLAAAMLTSRVFLG
ncbi:hypothetical protein PoB_000167100 [Plakobranchus ocellatus]|uniref:Uncharacterized protein n=1 Tax=Plakobranchus ocellatus TaxID=259542 RepID=A0AAV3XWI3_9GAST|nr:hypothetical protein PoB_000167100 [Plakobranchus ocellatus]